MDEKFLKPNQELLRLWREAVRMVQGPVGCSKRPRLGLYQETETMAKNKVNVRHDDSMTKEETAVAEREETVEKVSPATNQIDHGASYPYIPEEESDLNSNGKSDGALTTPNTVGIKPARKRPDRSNPPYYEIYSEKDGGKETKLEGRTETAGKALKFIYLHAARVAGDARKLYVVRCKRLTDAELLD